MSSISAQEFVERMKTEPKPHVLDVREDIEFHTQNIGGIHIPLGKLPTLLEDLEWNKNEEIIVICRAGIRSETARRILKQAGFTAVKNLTGGLTAVNRIMHQL